MGLVCTIAIFMKRHTGVQQVWTKLFFFARFYHLVLYIRAFFRLPKNYFRKVEFSCNFNCQEAKIITLLFAVMSVSGPY